jgi:MinD-like ATPase involved in chromosome partitioning or flagellar assembly
MFSIAALQSKGGTSKSTVTINVGIAAVCMGLS